MLLSLGACVHVPVDPSIGATPPPSGPAVGDVVSFDFASLDDRSFSAPALRGKPAVIVFLTSDSLPGQAEADILVSLAKDKPAAATYAFVATEVPERRELVVVFRHFFEEKAGVTLLGAMADKDTLLGQGPFGDVRGLTVVILDATGRMAFRRAGLVSGVEIARLLATL